MDSPFVEMFRRGDAPREVRLEAAHGRSAPRPLDQLAILMLLTSDSDAEVRETAEHTLSRIPQAGLSGFLARTEVSEDMRTFFRARGVAIASAAAPEQAEPFIDEDDTAYGPEDANADNQQSLTEKLAGMSVPQKVKAAMKGTREMRAVLIRDPNKLVSLAVLSSPKLTETEVESFARMGSVAEDVLRAISRTRAWMKNYSVVLALAKNAKTPVAVSMTLLPRLQESDVKRLSSDRNVPEPLRMAARKRIVMG
jgi:hypothetical protein